MEDLYLIRHGLTRYNTEKRYCGSTDVHLTQKENERLRSAAFSLPYGTHIITSGMIRCNETAEALFKDASYIKDPRFREIDFGIFEGRTYEELLSVPDYLRWCESDGMTAPPKGESVSEFESRVDEGLNALLASDGSYALVTHGGVIAHIMHRLFPDEHKSRYQWQPKHGDGYLITGSSYSLMKI